MSVSVLMIRVSTRVCRLMRGRAWELVDWCVYTAPLGGSSFSFLQYACLCIYWTVFGVVKRPFRVCTGLFCVYARLIWIFTGEVQRNQSIAQIYPYAIHTYTHTNTFREGERYTHTYTQERETHTHALIRTCIRTTHTHTHIHTHKQTHTPPLNIQKSPMYVRKSMTHSKKSHNTQKSPTNLPKSPRTLKRAQQTLKTALRTFKQSLTHFERIDLYLHIYDSSLTLRAP